MLSLRRHGAFGLDTMEQQHVNSIKSVHLIIRDMDGVIGGTLFQRFSTDRKAREHTSIAVIYDD